MTWFDAIIIAIVEGLTEFLPISSTGHMIIAQHLLGVPSSDFLHLYIVNIQFGAILSVVVLYFKKFFQSIKFYLKLFVAFIPAAVLGFFLGDYIDVMLNSVWLVSIALLVGGIIFLFVDKWFQNTNSNKEPSYSNAFVIGLFQCISLIPGISRSAATIIGGLTQKMNRKSAAEFSFFLAVPTMFAASVYKFFNIHHLIQDEHIKFLIVGNLVSFIVAMLAIKFFIYYLTRHGFKLFGWYRIALSIIIIILLLINNSLHIV